MPLPALRWIAGPRNGSFTPLPNPAAFTAWANPPLYTAALIAVFCILRGELHIRLMSKQTRHRRGQPEKSRRTAAVLRRASGHQRVRFESLEARTLFSIFPVTSTADSGAG